MVLKSLFRQLNVCSCLLIVSILCACNVVEIQLGDINLTDWKKDKYGCLGNRLSSIGILRDHKDNLLRHSETEIIKAIGLPEKAELIGHSEKYYSYNIDPAPECNETSPSSKYLRIRFNSVGHAREVLILDKKR